MKKEEEITNAQAVATLEASLREKEAVVINYIWVGYYPYFLIPDRSLDVMRKRYPFPDNHYDLSSDFDFLTYDLNDKLEKAKKDPSSSTGDPTIIENRLDKKR